MSHSQYCSAPFCLNTRQKGKGLSFFRFPKDEERAKIWAINTGREDLMRRTPKALSHVCLCADHFEDQQFMNTTERNKLVWNAIPTIFPISNLLKKVTNQRAKQQNSLVRAELQSENTSTVSDDINCTSNQEIPRSISSGELDRNEGKKINEEKKFQCDMCGKIYTRHWHLYNHVLTHTGERLFKCDICDKLFSEKLQLNKHVVLHSNGKNYVCHVCGRWFDRKAHVDLHMKIHHTREKKFCCSICKKTFSRRSCLRIHMLVHTDVKNFECEVCGKCFPQKSHLTVHNNVHVGERNFKCDQCDKDFPLKTDLINHLIVHTSKKKHQCVSCGKLFAWKSQLERHSVTHTESRSCEFCGQRFTHKSNLSKHLKVHARINAKLRTLDEKKHAINSLYEHTEHAESELLSEKEPDWNLETIFVVDSKSTATSLKTTQEHMVSKPVLQGNPDTNPVNLEQIDSKSTLQEQINPTNCVAVPDWTSLETTETSVSDTEIKQEIKEEIIEDYNDYSS